MVEFIILVWDEGYANWKIIGRVNIETIYGHLSATKCSIGQ